MTITYAPITNKAARYLLVAVGLFATAVTTTLVALLLQAAPAGATVPPDTCFDFTAGTGTIVEYYDNEGGNSANPSCPIDVDIPATIGGVAVTAIGNSAFENNSLGSVTIPSSVTHIGVSAFEDNNLTAVTIPQSVTFIGNLAFGSNELTSIIIPPSVVSIGNEAFLDNLLESVVFAAPSAVTTIGRKAFSENNITTVTIPASVTQLGSISFSYNPIDSVYIEGNPSGVRDAFLNNSLSQYNYRLTPIYSANAAFLAANDSSLVFEDESGWDQNGDGDTDDIYGGILINPSTLTVRYLDSQGASVAPEMTMFGDEVSDYSISALLAVNPAPVDADLANIYYIQGKSMTLTAPTIDGETPDAKTVILQSGANVVAFIYGEEDDVVIPGVPNTGAPKLLPGSFVLGGVVAASIFVVALATTIYVRRTQ